MEDYFKKFETPKWLKQSDNEVKFKLKMGRKKLFPVIKDNSLYVYKISSTNETEKIIKLCSDTLCDIHDVVTNDEKIKNDFYFRSSVSPYFMNLLSYHVSTKDDIYKYYKLDEIENRDAFIDLPQNVVYKSGDDFSFDGMINNMAKDYFTFVFKEPSKVSKIISFVSRYLDINYVASNIYYFLYSKNKDFFTGVRPIEEEELEIDKIKFNKTEMSLSEDEKISLIKSIIDSFKVECLYSSKVDELDDFVISNIFGKNSKKMVLDFAEHTADLVYNSEFSSIFGQNIVSKEKVFKLEKKKD